MKYLIETIPHAQQRYETIGDYWDADDSAIGPHKRIVVSEMQDSRMSFLVALHELIEFYLCDQNGVREPAIAAFDKAVPFDSPYADDPGNDPAAPYHYEHVFAECIERLVAREIGVNWQDYEAACEAVLS